LALSVKPTIVGAAIALAVSTVGATGTAYAAVPAHASTAVSVSSPHRPPPPHRFHSRFRTQQQCQFQARRDHPRDQSLWDCRHGRDHNNPWEYWGS
jgi:hypothetical protein